MTKYWTLKIVDCFGAFIFVKSLWHLYYSSVVTKYEGELHCALSVIGVKAGKKAYK